VNLEEKDDDDDNDEVPSIQGDELSDLLVDGMKKFTFAIDPQADDESDCEADQKWDVDFMEKVVNIPPTRLPSLDPTEVLQRLEKEWQMVKFHIIRASLFKLVRSVIKKVKQEDEHAELKKFVLHGVGEEKKNRLVTAFHQLTGISPEKFEEVVAKSLQETVVRPLTKGIANMSDDDIKKLSNLDIEGMQRDLKEWKNKREQFDVMASSIEKLVQDLQ
jgi:hypothetical protein